MPYGSIAADKITTSDGFTLGGSGATMKNRIINGAMFIAQRGTSAVTANDSYAVDRWNIGNTTDGAFSAVQDSEAPTGFNKSVKFTITTADASVTGTQSLFMVQVIEGVNCQDLNWGTANAKPVTLSFQVRSSVTGTFSGSLVNNGLDRSYPFTYTISSANTWTPISITVPGDTTGTWVTNTDAGIRVYFSLGTGSTRLGTANAWGGARYQGATGETALVNTLNATWYITGVQLEVGSQATSFDYRQYGAELVLCQRYYQYYYGASGKMSQPGSSSTYIAMPVYFKVSMRATPTVTWNAPSLGTAGRVEQWGGTERVVSTNDVTAHNLAYVILSSGITTADTVSGNLTLVSEL